jgi:ADP-ribose pyrophosphatase
MLILEGFSCIVRASPKIPEKAPKKGFKYSCLGLNMLASGFLASAGKTFPSLKILGYALRLRAAGFNSKRSPAYNGGCAMADYEITRSETVYEGYLVDIVKDHIILPDGREALREIVLHGEAAAILPVTASGELVLVRQYRHAARTMSLEMPAGIMEKGEDPLECAKRELAEETGATAGKMTFMFKFYSSIGFCTELLHLYLAQDLTEGEQSLDDDEFVEIERLTPDKAVELIKSGEILDSKTIAAVMYYLHLLRD